MTEAKLLVLRSLSILFIICNASSVQKRATICLVNPLLPCECTNPFLLSVFYLLGDPAQTCQTQAACYVENVSGCSDSTPAKGGGRCQSGTGCQTMT